MSTPTYDPRYRQRDDARERTTFTPVDGGSARLQPLIIASQFQATPRTSWWTVAEDGEAFTREARQAQARMCCDPKVKTPDVSHLREIRR